ncbi:MAG: hypothetical protein WC835_00055 [Candidatus Paceibacterota bacterium]|jgi:hypothetical protein
MEILGKLFGSEARVRMLRLFFLNPDTIFDAGDIAQKTKTKPAVVRREISVIQSVGIIRRCSFPKEINRVGKITKSNKGKKKITAGWCLDKTFSHGDHLRNLLVSASFFKKNDILSKFKNAGRIKLLVISGIFIKDENSRIDIFIVGDGLKKGAIDSILRSFEAEAGKELRYSVLDTKEFKYRLDMYDKFVRDILDYPHETIIDRLGTGIF